MGLADSGEAAAVATAPQVTYRGVSLRSFGKYIAEIQVNGDKKKKYLGSFDSPKVATRKFDEAVIRYNGVRAKLNFPNEISAAEDAIEIDLKFLVASAKLPNGAMAEKSASQFVENPWKS